ncbi:MAG: glutamate--tRNA ligase [Deltaproteobacteria bacterium]|nr:glutamate--tRNA ligase [Deltaproteobacteria bacterium]
MADNVRVRIAPSPTGDPHVGTAYVGLVNHAFARQNGGAFILRIEDTDRERSTRESENAIYEALRWVGLEWDEGPDVGGPHGPYRQSERAEIYREHVARLVEKGAAYPCFCTARRLEELRQRRRAEKAQITGYDGLCRSIPREDARARMAAGEPHVIRLAMPIGGTTTVHDRLRGTVEFDNGQMDDQVLLKSDGFPTYHLANVVDDRLMGITHVIRAEEWITSTPKHVVLYGAFGWTPPEFVHLPLLRNKDKSKISKRKNPVSLLYYRQIGILPETMRNFLALLGHSMPDEREVFELAEFVRDFSFDRISLGGPVFDVEKLLWLNGVRLRAMDPATIAARLRESVYSADRLARLVPLVQERVRTLGEFAQATSWFDLHAVPLPVDELAASGKGRAPKAIADLLTACQERTDSMKSFDHESLEAAMRALAEEKGVGASELFMALRIALTGRKATPPLFETMAVLGRASVAQRLRTAAEALMAFRPKA